MNRVIVRITAAAIAEVLADEGADGPVVVGYDARHGSVEFAHDTARVVAARGRRAVVVDEALPTPVIAFAVRRLGAAAGVMVTASHNPPGDNGFKVYWGDGAQIVPPTDARISAAMDEVGLVADADLAPADDQLVTNAPEGLVEEYLGAVAGLRATDEPVRLRVAHTSLHGVGGELIGRAFRRAGLDEPVVVAEQHRPDPDFPTVDYPNPEEPGAMDLVLALAQRIGADVALANDPDADRLAMAVPDRDGAWRVLRGDELGWLLAHHVLTTTSGERLVSTSIVSSAMLDRMAEAHGATHHRTLTGFKWIVRPALAPGAAPLVFAYEEALGYLVGDVVLDKDGVSAAVVATEAVARLRDEGRDVGDLLDELAARHGVHLPDGWSVRFEGPDGASRREAIMAAWRHDPPGQLGGRPVRSVADLATHDPPTDAVVVAADGVRLTVRPSGTEPKIKYYVEAITPAGDDLAQARRQGAEVIAAIRRQVER